ncbi:unnamed protein product [Ceutorhynchus assimilis]|uniref:FP protein C-terminal domain-containing protein n=1 Tax=Ceutorhynchus assimilis TaxID=467358 RepID=A0A9N9MDA3_9CUCU|nr:unnamed protein product [Ceutorhynchus assimilis]
MGGSKECKAYSKSMGKKLKLNCGGCNGYFYLDCGKVSEVDARLMHQEKRPWNCDECTKDRVARRSTIFNISSSESQSQGIGELKSMIRELQTDVRDMRNAMDFLNEKYEDEKKRSKIMSDMVGEISKENQTLKDKVEKLEAALIVQENEKIKNNICIDGLAKDGERADGEKLKKLFTYLNTPVPDNAIENMKQVQTKNGPKIIITLSTLDLKERILKARSQIGKITIRKTGLGEENSAIYISEELTKEVYSLFKSAEGLKDKGFKYVWHKNGTVFARKQDGENAILIKNSNTLSQMLL